MSRHAIPWASRGLVFDFVGFLAIVGLTVLAIVVLVNGLGEDRLLPLDVTLATTCVLFALVWFALRERDKPIVLTVRDDEVHGLGEPLTLGVGALSVFSTTTTHAKTRAVTHWFHLEWQGRRLTTSRDPHAVRCAGEALARVLQVSVCWTRGTARAGDGSDLASLANGAGWADNLTPPLHALVKVAKHGADGEGVRIVARRRFAIASVTLALAAFIHGVWWMQTLTSGSEVFAFLATCVWCVFLYGLPRALIGSAIVADKSGIKVIRSLLGFFVVTLRLAKDEIDAVDVRHGTLFISGGDARYASVVVAKNAGAAAWVRGVVVRAAAFEEDVDEALLQRLEGGAASGDDERMLARTPRSRPLPPSSPERLAQAREAVRRKQLKRSMSARGTTTNAGDAQAVNTNARAAVAAPAAPAAVTAVAAVAALAVAAPPAVAAPAAVAPDSSRTCPRCLARTLGASGGVLDDATCAQCSGRFLSPAGAERLIEGELGVSKETLRAILQSFAGKRLTCPGCNSMTSAARIRGVACDLCTGCGGLWLDDGELSTLTQGRHQG